MRSTERKTGLWRAAEAGNPKFYVGDQVRDRGGAVDTLSNLLGKQRQFQFILVQLFTRVDVFDVLVIVAAYRDEFLALFHRIQIILRLRDLFLAHGFYRFQEAALLALAQLPHCLGVFLFERPKQCTAQRLHVVTHLVGFLQQDVEAIERQRGVQVSQSRTDIQTSCNSLDQRGRVNRWFKQRQLAHHAFDSHAVADFVEPVSHGVPVTQHLVVLRDTEVEHRQGRRVTLCLHEIV